MHGHTQGHQAGQFTPGGEQWGLHGGGTFAELKPAQVDLVWGKPIYCDQELREGNSTLVTFFKGVLLE